MIRRARARWRGVLLVCAKCEKKLKGGFGAKGRDDLSALLRERAGGKGGKARFGVVSTRCLKLCPKGAVAVVDAARPDAWLVVEAGTRVEAVEAEVPWLAAASPDGAGAIPPAPPFP